MVNSIYMECTDEMFESDPDITEEKIVYLTKSVR